MLTRELLRYHVRKGLVRPRFVDSTAPLMAHAERLLGAVHGACGHTRGAVEAQLADCLGGDVEPLIHRGLVKLVLDRCSFGEAPAEVSARRLALFAQSTAALRQLAPTDSWEALHRALPAAPCIDTLYEDLPEQRPLVEFRALQAAALLQRYNMALAQGLVIACDTFTLRTPDHSVLPLRRMLRWLKFCRLVAEVRRGDDGGWEVCITGPAAVLALAKAYGLQLANFLPAVPLLTQYTVEAQVQLRRGNPWRLLLTQDDPLVSPHGQALGHTPAEFTTLVNGFADSAWTLSTEVEPRAVGATGMMVPDLLFQHSGGRHTAVELFHRWHQHSLTQRLAQLATRPDAGVLLGIDRSLLRQEPVAEALAQHAAAVRACTFEFTGFPTPRRLLAALNAHGDV